MTDRAGQDIEFVPSDEIVEPEPADTEDDAVHPQEGEEPRVLMIVEAANFDVDQLSEDEADELEVEAVEAAESETEAPEEPVQEEHEEGVEEILHRHYGIVSAEPDEAPPRSPTGEADFVCRSCFLSKPTTQLADPTRDVCVDCAANGA